MSAPILVTGATGRHGSTGAHVARRLSDEGHSVRVLARTPSARTAALVTSGIEVFFGDLHDHRSLAGALAGVDSVYFTYPIAAGVIPAAANYTAAVRATGRPIRTVLMSMAPAHPKHPSHLGRDQWVAEELVQWAGLDVLILRVAATFHENLTALHAHSIRTEDTIRNSFGDGAVGYIGGRDAAELAVAALLHPERFTGPICYPPGPEQFTHAQLAEVLTDELDRAIRYVPISRDEWRQELVELAAENPGGVVNDDMASHISAVGQHVAQSGATIPGDAAELRRLTGVEPTTLREFIRANRAELSA
jgi:uncharacterized protein YbjT (DUF2867 family)